MRAPDAAISSFTGRYIFLSNFFRSPVSLDGTEYPTVEHAFQATKSLDYHHRYTIRTMYSPGAAKRIDQRVKLRKDWEHRRLDIMEELLRRKFESPVLRRRLTATAPSELVEDNTWEDRFWGQCGGEGENHLGRLLMKIRDDL